jgi:organic hydroperoxide reductase OsmC/OhrA
MGIHQYHLNIQWTGNLGKGTVAADQYSRNHRLNIENKISIQCSSDTIFRGDGSLHNPEDFFLYSIASCHMLWYLHLCADAGVIVETYEDNPIGVLDLSPGKKAAFTKITLRPNIGIRDAAMIEKAISLHHAAHEKCFISNSVNCEIVIEPNIKGID